MSYIPKERVTAVTIMYGDRWKFLSQVVEAVMKDPYITQFIIVDNGSKNREQILQGTRQYGDRVQVLRQEKNLGSAGGFAVALAAARETDCDYVFILDDDSVPEAGTVEQFLENLTFFPHKEKVILSANRIDVPGNGEVFYQLPAGDLMPRGTVFEVFSFAKLAHFFRLLTSGGKKRRGLFIPIVPTEGFVYGGSFLPIEAVRRAPLPDAELFLYGDDTEYAWRMRSLGYRTYVCASPILHDIDLTFAGSYIAGLFDPKTQPFKVYYNIRNRVRISVRNSKQAKLVLFVNIVLWLVGFSLLGLYRSGFSRTYRSRVALAIKAAYAGYYPDAKIPKEAVI